MIGFLISAIKIIFLLGFLIFIHEGGHFLVAKLCKVRVNEFAIGFGPTIWKKQGKETKYALRLIPLGGFVSMEGEEEASDKEGSFSKASIPKRIAIVVAGATVNIVFGLVVYFALMASTGVYVSTEVDYTLDGYVSQEAGLQANDKIIEIDGQKVKTKSDVSAILDKSQGEELSLKLERNGEVIYINLVPTEQKVKSTGIYLSDSSKIIAVDKGSAAEKQGIKANDNIIKINGQEVNGDPQKVLELISQETEGDILFTIERSGKTQNINLVPDYISKYYLGVAFKQADDTIANHIYYGIVATKDFAFSIIDNLKELFSGKVSVDQMMGPVGISDVVASTSGLQEFIYILALISLSLGVTNLLPIPALDGGKIVILIVEAIRRKPLKPETEATLTLLGFSFIIALSIYVTYNDVLRIF